MILRRDEQVRLPADSVFLPLTSGSLLVSRDHAVFCRVPDGHMRAVRSVMEGHANAADLEPDLLADLRRHGFFGPPREPKPDHPSVQLQLTNACNLACGYCCTNSGKARDREVCFEAMLEVVRQIPMVLGERTSVALLGGEPLAVPWAIDLGAAVLDRGLMLTIFTNGVPLAQTDTARRVAELMARGAEVRVSLAGPSAVSCDSVSGAERFDPAVRGVNLLADFGGRAVVDVMIVPQYVDSLAGDLPALRRALPANTRIALGVLYHSGREAGEHLFKSRAELEKALDRIALEAGESIPAAETRPVMYRREGCTCALGQHVHVRSDGALFNCFKMEEQVGTLESDGFAAAARAIRDSPHRAGDLPTCRACPLATLCGGGCRSENFLYTGDPDRPPCGPWRTRVVSELLAEDCVSSVEWPVAFLLEEANARGIETPEIAPSVKSRHLVDV